MKKYTIRKGSPAYYIAGALTAAAPLAVIAALGVVTTLIEGGGVIR